MYVYKGGVKWNTFYSGSASKILTNINMYNDINVVAFFIYKIFLF